MPEGQFDKDFGYLIPFLDKVAAAANNLADPAAREELKKLMMEEKSKWARIRQLLSGATGQSQSRPLAAAQTGPAISAPATGDSQSISKEQISFTVGSLRPRAR